MRHILFSATLAAMLCLASQGNTQTLADLVNDEATPGDVLVHGMGYSQNRYSPLDQINKQTVGDLRPVWTYSLADTRAQESFPLLHDGVLYLTTHNSTVALDALTGRQIWKTMVEYPPETPRVACCGIVNRGAAILDGRLFRTTLDAYVIALDMKTGEEIWRTHSIDFHTGYSMTVAPLIADGVVIVGISGGEYGIRGYLEGYDPESGERLWRTYTIPAPGEPGSETWKDGGDAWKRGGAPTWLTGSYDPELNTVYWGTGNAASWNAAVRPGDNLYTSSILAITPSTGEIKWHYQTSPNDPFDHDGTNELVLTELDGRKVVMQASRNGFYYVIDRENGELLAASQFVDRLNWADGVDLETGRPIHTQLYRDTLAGKEVEYWPGAFGGKNWGPSAYDAERETVFANTLNIGMKYKGVEPVYRPGLFYFGAEFAFVWPDDNMRGSLRAMDPRTAEVKWEQRIGVPRNAGILATAGGVIFTGNQTGDMEAFDSDTGDLLWSYQTGSGVVSQPITWERDGKQYITALSGGGAVYALFAGDERLAGVPAGGNVWTFALGN